MVGEIHPIGTATVSRGRTISMSQIARNVGYEVTPIRTGPADASALISPPPPPPPPPPSSPITATVARGRTISVAELASKFEQVKMRPAGVSVSASISQPSSSVLVEKLSPSRLQHEYEAIPSKPVSRSASISSFSSAGTLSLSAPRSEHEVGHGTRTIGSSAFQEVDAQAGARESEPLFQQQGRRVSFAPIDLREAGTVTYRGRDNIDPLRDGLYGRVQRIMFQQVAPAIVGVGVGSAAAVGTLHLLNGSPTSSNVVMTKKVTTDENA